MYCYYNYLLLCFYYQFFLFLLLCRKVSLFLYHQKNLSKLLPTIFCAHVYQEVWEIRLGQFFFFLILPVSFSYKFRSSFHAILTIFCVIGVFATFLTNFKCLLPIPRCFCNTCCCLPPLPFCAAFSLQGRAKRTLAGKLARAICWYLAINVLPLKSYSLWPFLFHHYYSI